MEYTLREIDESRKGDLRLKNEPFPLCGRLLPAYDGEWSYSVRRFPNHETGEMTFPDEDYDYDAMKGEHFFLGVYGTDGKCVGLAVYRKSWNKYLYLYDLKVDRDCRGQGVGTLLIGGGKALAAREGYRGIWCVCQDNNLTACLFYLKAGFRIGGLDTKVYDGTNQAGKSDVHFYLDL